LVTINFNEEDSISIYNTFWYPYVEDDATPDSLMHYQISQGNRINILTEGDSTVFKSDVNWFGSDTLQLSVTDLGDSTTSAALIVSVNPVNDPPEFYNLPDSLKFYSDSSGSIKLWDYVSDVESSDSLLTWDFNASPDSLIMNFQNSTGHLTLSSSGYIGEAELLITVSDDSSAAVSDTISIYSIFRDVNPPQFIESLPEINFNEDESHFVMNSFWYPYIHDDETVDSLLTFRIFDGRNVSVISNADTNVFSAGLNWFGSDTLLLTVSEPWNIPTSSSFIVSVHPVNDPPELHDLPDSLYFFADSSISLKLWPYVTDVESPDSALTWEFTISPDSLLIDFQRSTGTLTVSSSEFIGTADIMISVSDDSLASTSDTIYITSLPPDQNPPQFLEPLPMIAFNEDDSVFVNNSFWYPYVFDLETADSLLLYNFSQGKNVFVSSWDDISLFKAGQNWYGMDTLQISVTDFGNYTRSSDFVVSVHSVNDPPVIIDLPDSITIEYQSSYSFNVWSIVEDVESHDSLLTYKFWFTTDSISTNFEEGSGHVELTPSGDIVSTTLFLQVSDDSSASVLDSLMINIENVSGVHDVTTSGVPENFVLMQNFPNPFNPVTTIIFGLPISSDIILEIYDIVGRKILTLYEGKKPAGYHNFIWDAKNYSSGIYIYRLSTRGPKSSEMIKKMVLLK
jgi:hypothetical protein